VQEKCAPMLFDFSTINTGFLFSSPSPLTYRTCFSDGKWLKWSPLFPVEKLRLLIPSSTVAFSARVGDSPLARPSETVVMMLQSKP
jgi:hypothetical protein